MGGNIARDFHDTRRVTRQGARPVSVRFRRSARGRTVHAGDFATSLGSAPHDYAQLKEAIAKRRVTFSPGLEKIMRYALRYPERMAFDTTCEIARKCDVSASTVRRLAQHLGFDNVRAIRMLFQDYLRCRNKR